MGVWVFDWERYWPVIPWMIVPYWSIDAVLRARAVPLPDSREELGVHRRRIVFTILAAASAFLLIPLRFAFPRPHVEGLFAPWFAALYSFDLPHNLFPSLHIALRTLLAEFTREQARGPSALAVARVVQPRGISTLLTWQHHLVDVVGGFWLAAIAMQLYRFDEAPPHVRRTRGWRSATRWLRWPARNSRGSRGRGLSSFVWPAFAFGAAAWLRRFGNALYRKREGRVTLATKSSSGRCLPANGFRGSTTGANRRAGTRSRRGLDRLRFLPRRTRTKRSRVA